MNEDRLPPLVFASTETNTNDTWLATTAPIVQADSRAMVKRAG